MEILCLGSLCGRDFVDVLVVIPARYGSSRFEGKVLARETGKYLVEHTYERALCAKTVGKVLIATDSEDVMRACEGFGADCVMTSVDHQSGTDRIAEAVADIEADVILNLQADEPEINPGDIDLIRNEPEFIPIRPQNRFQSEIINIKYPQNHCLPII